MRKSLLSNRMGRRSAVSALPSDRLSGQPSMDSRIGGETEGRKIFRPYKPGKNPDTHLSADQPNDGARLAWYADTRPDSFV